MARPPLSSLLALALSLAGCASEPPAEAPDAAERRVFVVRHAEAYKNLVPRPDLPAERLDSLTERGRGQARALAERLRERGVARVLFSPTGRTRQTAELLAELLGVPAEVAPELAPLEAGRTPAGEPVTWGWREARWSAGEDPRPEGGESLEDGVERALGRVAQAPGEGALVLVTHGDIAAGLLGHAAQTPAPERWARHEPPGGSLTELRSASGSWTLGATWTPPTPAQDE